MIFQMRSGFVCIIKVAIKQYTLLYQDVVQSVISLKHINPSDINSATLQLSVGE